MFHSLFNPAGTVKVTRLLSETCQQCSDSRDCHTCRVVFRLGTSRCSDFNKIFRPDDDSDTKTLKSFWSLAASLRSPGFLTTAERHHYQPTISVKHRRGCFFCGDSSLSADTSGFGGAQSIFVESLFHELFSPVDFILLLRRKLKLINIGRSGQREFIMASKILPLANYTQPTLGAEENARASNTEIYINNNIVPM